MRNMIGGMRNGPIQIAITGVLSANVKGSEQEWTRVMIDGLMRLPIRRPSMNDMAKLLTHRSAVIPVEIITRSGLRLAQLKSPIAC